MPFSDRERHILEYVMGHARAPDVVILAMDEYIAASPMGKTPDGRALVKRLRTGGEAEKRAAAKMLGIV